MLSTMLSSDLDGHLCEEYVTEVCRFFPSLSYSHDYYLDIFMYVV